ncbi:N-acyl-D-amino-acid deacylase family protein [Ilumatobacter coccineus]|uniref:Putative hydrolase n=1 Tax=Ilumatobacter coccineus (strain NBRC 103263 / KCTC 29153 / YM16-304) TaxID=1313172 RepID=A0A6C7E796_ILUCY|nr:amidohydrolase family protein [Ilumatobacter coccineus]BAN00478.1 putative hydrolase [Ilumatobacter coccineus YM16-304]
MHDLVIRNGRLVDGTGAAPADGMSVAVDGNVITAVAPDAEVGPGTREIDAQGKIITPGFVDIHTHYDGQATWDSELEPSTPHGVTTVVMGNCGVGFAPAKPDEHDFLIELMEGVEDIPGAALSEGISWNWESFPEYLDELERGEYAADIAAMIAHGPLRAYVMGKRGADNEPATSDDIAEMAQLVNEAVEAGAMGFSTSRTIGHRAMNGEPVPGTFAAEDELFTIGRAMARAGKGVFEVAPAGLGGEDLVAPKKEIDWICRLADDIGRPVTWLMLQNMVEPDEWKELMERSQEAQDAGHQVIPQVAGRPFGILIGLSTKHRFKDMPSFAPLRDLSFAEQAEAMGDPELKARLIAESTQVMESIKDSQPMAYQVVSSYERQYLLGDPVDYEPTPDRSIAALAEQHGVEPIEELYERLRDREGRALMMMPFLGYAHGNGDALHEMLTHPAAVLGLADGGAHANFICDASTPTWMLTHWVRDRERGPRLPLEHVIKKMTADTAALFGFTDRGVVEVGKRADLNVIDFDNLQLREPHLVADLPAGGTRLLQAAEGYTATIVGGQVTRENDAFTGARPGRLVRS